MNKISSIINGKAGQKFIDIAKSLTPGAVAGTVATMSIMPIDTISDTQKQWRNTKNEPELNRIGRSFGATAKELYNPKERPNSDKGMAPFYTGAGGKLLKVVPSTAISYALAQYLERRIKGGK